MESPIKIDLPSLSHIDILHLLLPLIPGVVITTGVTLSSSTLAQKFWGIGVGYKTKVAIAIALTYIIGLAMMTMVDTASEVVIGLIKPPSKTPPWENSFWKRVAIAYVGSDLSPDLSSPRIESVEAYLSGLGNIVPPGVAPKLVVLQKSIQGIETNLKTLSESQAEKPLTKDQLVLLSKAKQLLADSEQSLREQAIKIEWWSLYHALQFLPKKLYHPYSPFALLMTSMQATGVAAIWLIVRYGEFRSVASAFIAVTLIVTGSYTQWLVVRMNRYYKDLCSEEIAALLQQLRKRAKTEGSVSSPVRSATD